MVKKFAILFFCGFLATSSNAQNFGGGIILGLSTSQVGGDDLGGFNKAGLLAGVFANKSISPLFSFQMEMTYIQKGSNNPKMNVNPEPKPDISLSYVEIPLLLQYHQSEILKIEGGLLSAYLIDGYYNDQIGKIPNETNPFINYDLGLFLGLDYKYSGNLSLNTRICNSILPIGSEDYDGVTVHSSNMKGKYNSVLSFAIHYNL
tara:strand:+ start:83 stop:694 length:612 start_codon:yes stop_codon:yes gene_type:complete